MRLKDLDILYIVPLVLFIASAYHVYSRGKYLFGGVLDTSLRDEDFL